jgi:hypothetical protein
MTISPINELAAALAKAQAVMPNAVLNKVNPHFKSRYADLQAVRDAVLPALTANGISVMQGLEAQPDGSELVLTYLVHSSGQFVRSSMRIPGGLKIQERGSAITYARRYQLAALACVASEEDDDGNAANVAPAVDDNGYLDWIANLESEFAGSGLSAVTDAIKNDDVPESWRAKLRADKVAWDRIKASAMRGAK